MEKVMEWREGNGGRGRFICSIVDSGGGDNETELRKKREKGEKRKRIKKSEKRRWKKEDGYAHVPPPPISPSTG